MTPLASETGPGHNAGVSQTGRVFARTAALLVVAAGLAACDGAGGSNGNGGGATVPQDTSTTSTTAAPIDITVRPDVITVEYAEAVMA